MATSKRFEAIAQAKELVIVPEKSAVRVELQYGKEGEPTELVIAEMYWHEGAWKYTRSQVRMTCTKDNVQYVLEACKAMYASAAKVDKKPKASKIETAIDSMTDEEKAALLEMLLGKAKPKTTGKSTVKEDPTELILESFKTRKRK